MIVHLVLAGFFQILILIIYFYIARRLNILDTVNERSSHWRPTIRGGGIIFPSAVFIWFAFEGLYYPWFSLGLFILSLISFLDDLYSLPPLPRFVVQLISAVLLLYQTDFFFSEWFWWPLGLILIIGWVNAFNFMDGINGITSFYSLAVLLPFYLINGHFGLFDPSLLLSIGLALLIFSFFNARKTAICFAGDVGSISLAFIIAFFVLSLILHTEQWQYILLIAVYGVDSSLTIFHRLLKGENIFEAHRSHLYQYLANELKLGHIKVAVIYALSQLLISYFSFSYYNVSALASVLILGLLSLLYILIKYLVLRKVY